MLPINRAEKGRVRCAAAATGWMATAWVSVRGMDRTVAARKGLSTTWSLIAIILAEALVATAALADGPERAGLGSRPNIVFLYTDDQAQWAMGAYGNRDIRTPNLDRLAQAGAIFHNAFTVTPVCSPSRAALMTSRYPSELGIADWIDPQKEPDLGLAPAAIIWPELLRGFGYATMLAGKWHLGISDEFHPTRQGFDRFFGFRDGSNRPINPMLEIDGQLRHFKGSLPDLLVDEGLKFVEAHRDRPFLLSIHFRAPHTPYAPVPEQDSAFYRTLDPAIPDFPGLPRNRVKQITRDYYASVSSVDRNVGRLRAKIDELQLTSRTVVIFTSDHGYMIGQHGLWHKGNAAWLVAGKTGYRPNMFDDATRVPLLLSWPGVIRPGTKIERVVSNLDLFPTVLDFAGLGQPDNLIIRGRSLVPLLRGQSIPWDDTLFGQYDMHHDQVARMRMIRTPEWKLVRHFEPEGRDELYHLTEDSGETHDLASSTESKNREESDGLTRRLDRWMAEIGDRAASVPTHSQGMTPSRPSSDTRVKPIIDPKGVPGVSS
jgi:choline-sulfatase